MQTVVLQGHSTGCQDSVRYMQNYGKETGHPAGVILQASVSTFAITLLLSYLLIYMCCTPLCRNAHLVKGLCQRRDIMSLCWQKQTTCVTSLTEYSICTECTSHVRSCQSPVCDTGKRYERPDNRGGQKVWTHEKLATYKHEGPPTLLIRSIA